jgi:hypothetical protein
MPEANHILKVTLIWLMVLAFSRYVIATPPQIRLRRLLLFISDFFLALTLGIVTLPDFEHSTWKLKSLSALLLVLSLIPTFQDFRKRLNSATNTGPKSSSQASESHA